MTQQTESNEQMEQSLIDIAVESWRFSRLFGKVVSKLDAGESGRYVNQLRYFQNKVEESLDSNGLKLVNVERLSEKYQVDELAAKYAFTGRTTLTVVQALAVKEELETIDKLLKQLEEAAKTAQIAVIDVDELSQFVDPEQMESLNALQKQVEEMVRRLAEEQGMEKTKKGYQLTPKAYRIFQGKLLEQIFSQLQASRTGRHTGPIVGEGAVELPSVKPYEFGDSVANTDIVGTFTNALIRSGGTRPMRLKSDDIEIHRTRNAPKCATVVVMDMSGSMGRSGLYVHVKRMALAMDGLIRREYPGDFLQFVEMYAFAILRALLGMSLK